MAGLAATLNASDAIEALAGALAPRGPEGAVCHLDGPSGVHLTIAVRAVLPSIARVVAAQPPQPPQAAQPAQSAQPAQPPPLREPAHVMSGAPTSTTDARWSDRRDSPRHERRRGQPGGQGVGRPTNPDPVTNDRATTDRADRATGDRAAGDRATDERATNDRYSDRPRNGVQNQRQAAPVAPTAPVIAAIAVDGVASMSDLDAGYAADGPRGLLRGVDPYATILADAERGALVLARNGTAPGLYYAWHGNGWLVASEPAALLAAGVPARPDSEVIGRFIRTGATDDTGQTFIATIAQVRPDEVVVLNQDGAHPYRAESEPHPPSLASALQEAVGQGRLAVLLRPGTVGAAVLGAALAQPGRLHPLPVHTAAFPDLDPPASHTPAVLVPLPHGTVRHTPRTFDVSTLDLDAFLREVGEPVPDLDLYLLWAVARDAGSGIDVVVDSGSGHPGAVARLNDRLTSRYGVSVRCPLREATGDVAHEDLAAIIGRTLPPPVARYATRDSARPATAAEIVLRLRDEVGAALTAARPWTDPAASVEVLRRLAAGEPVDAAPLLRAYLVERWLSTLTEVTGVTDTGSAAAPEPGPAETPPPREPVGLGEVAPAGSLWLRWPIRTEAIGPGAQLPSALAWYLGTTLTELRSRRRYAEALRGPWFAVVSAKVLAVAQRRVSPLWNVQHGQTARLLARVAGPRLPLLREPWSAQVALDEVGAARLLAAVTAARLGLSGLVERLLPDGAPVFLPRAEAMPPADSAVVRAPVDADGTAEALVAALRYSLPSAVFQTLAGCAVVRADETGSRVLGYGPGPFTDAVPFPADLVARACADNPAGQGREQTPLLLILEAPVPKGRR